ncbi:chaperonin 10-like protein [Coniochaeta sp. 2T2.1]|nr:chaperonin 10-like protein [Coniochaeta sp. 2T2.1]
MSERSSSSLVQILCLFRYRLRPILIEAMNHWQENGKFKGWLALDKNAAAGQMEWGGFEPKPWEKTDIDIKITHCGMCGSDMHVLRSEWGPTSYPLVVGHEIVGIAERVGTDVHHIRVGDRVGVGAQSDACLCRKPPAVAQDWSSCEACVTGHENRCPRASMSYNGVFHSAAADGAKTMGGYASYHRCPSHFVFKIPNAISSEHAAPLMCAGATVYSALGRVRTDPTGGMGQHLRGLRVGVIGVGGLGHLAIQFARAMGAEHLMAISRKVDKLGDVLELGAHSYIATDGEDVGTQENDLDLIISTIAADGTITKHLRLLKPGGRYIVLGMQDAVLFDGKVLVVKEIGIMGSLIASPSEVRNMLQFAAEHCIKPWVEVRQMSQANSALEDMEAGKARYRYVLCNNT